MQEALDVQPCLVVDKALIAHAMSDTTQEALDTHTRLLEGKQKPLVM